MQITYVSGSIYVCQRNEKLLSVCPELEDTFDEHWESYHKPIRNSPAGLNPIICAHLPQISSGFSCSRLLFQRQIHYLLFGQGLCWSGQLKAPDIKTLNKICQSSWNAMLFHATQAHVFIKTHCTSLKLLENEIPISFFVFCFSPPSSHRAWLLYPATYVAFLQHTLHAVMLKPVWQSSWDKKVKDILFKNCAMWRREKNLSVWKQIMLMFPRGAVVF